MADVVANSAPAIMSNLITGVGSSVPKYVGWGTGAGTAAKTDTDLFTPGSEDRVSGLVSRVTTTLTNDTMRVVGVISADAAKTITNAALFDAPSGGNLFVKSNFAGMALGAAGDAIMFTFNIQFGN